VQDPQHRVEERDGMVIEWDVPIVMDDGLVLRADVYRPLQAGRHPVLMTHGPYAKGLSFQEGFAFAWMQLERDHPDALEGSSNKYQAWETPDPEIWTRDWGYVCVRVDSRGAGRSPGVLDCFSARETRDYANCVEWAGVQPWSNGKVGLTGISYYAMNQWQVAALKPKHLAAICPFEGAADLYRDGVRHGGILTSFWIRWYPAQVSSVQNGLGTRGRINHNTGEPIAGPQTEPPELLARRLADLPAEHRGHDLFDAYFQERTPKLEDIEVPILSRGNWGGIGLHLRGNTEGFMRAGSRQKWLEMHGDTHWTEYYTPAGRNLMRRFYDHFLKGEDNGWDREPAVLLNVRHPGERFAFRKEHEWPLARTQWTRAYLDAAQGALVASLDDNTSLHAPFGDAMAMAVATHLVEHYAAGRGTTEKTCVLSARQMRQLSDFVRERLSAPCDVARLAQLVDLSPAHFSRCFKASSGLTPHQFVIRLKLEHARELLLTTDLAVADVAHAIGYASRAHFAQAFRQHWGAPPAQLRRLH
jgi:putative CocE/NonD family hydrolase